jgi:hypothetical protein
MMVSMPFLILTLIVYISFDELKNLHGKCLMSYILTLIVLQVDLIIIQLILDEPGKLCAFTGYLLYFTSMLNCVWLCVMSYDIWRALE